MAIITSQLIGTTVTHTQRRRPILMTIAFATTHQPADSNRLIRNPEQRPQRIYSSEWVQHALIEEITPSPHDQPARKQHPRHPTGSAKWFPHSAAKFLNHEPPYACAGVEDRKDKQRFKHNGEVV